MSYSGNPPILGFQGGQFVGWLKFNFDSDDFTAAAHQESISLYTLPAGGIIHTTKVKHSTAFSGGGATSATLEIGISGNEDMFGPEFNVFQATSAVAFQITVCEMTCSHTATTPILLTLRSDIDVKDLTAGVVDVWLFISTAV